MRSVLISLNKNEQSPIRALKSFLFINGGKIVLCGWGAATTRLEAFLPKAIKPMQFCGVKTGSRKTNMRPMEIEGWKILLCFSVLVPGIVQVLSISCDKRNEKKKINII